MVVNSDCNSSRIHRYIIIPNVTIITTLFQLNGTQVFLTLRNDTSLDFLSAILSSSNEVVKREIVKL